MNIKGAILSTGATIIGKQNDRGDFEDCIILSVNKNPETKQIEVIPFKFGHPFAEDFKNNKVYKNQILGEFKINEEMKKMYIETTSNITLATKKDEKILNNRVNIFKK